MRVFKDLGMVEYLGSGVPRIVHTYSKNVFEFTSRFVRVSLPISLDALQLETENDSTHLGAQSEAQSERDTHGVNILKFLLKNDLSISEIREYLALESNSGALKRALKWLVVNKFIEYTIPEKPSSRLQRYRITKKGKQLLAD